jgi:hypothetical protein
MRYALLVGHDEAAMISTEERSRRTAALSSFAEQMRATGVLTGGERLQPADTAVTVRCWDGADVIVSDGPLAPSREQIAGVFVVDCQDLDEAITVATKVPAAWYGAVEVRPVREV